MCWLLCKAFLPMVNRIDMFLDESDATPCGVPAPSIAKMETMIVSKPLPLDNPRTPTPSYVLCGAGFGLNISLCSKPWFRPQHMFMP